MAEVRWSCYQCGKVYKTKEDAVRCHNAPVQPFEDVPNPPKLRWWAGR